jgi:hypothetical protein
MSDGAQMGRTTQCNVNSNTTVNTPQISSAEIAREGRTQG